ncbi:hypothetical protein GMMP15_2050001 [Candidatus Magnetomoraceae bacterium gMMP-15]
MLRFIRGKKNKKNRKLTLDFDFDQSLLKELKLDAKQSGRPVEDFCLYILKRFYLIPQVVNHKQKNQGGNNHG